MDLNHYRTCELVDELEGREGIKKITVKPYEKEEVLVEGPTVILIVTD